MSQPGQVRAECSPKGWSGNQTDRKPSDAAKAHLCGNSQLKAARLVRVIVFAMVDRLS